MKYNKSFHGTQGQPAPQNLDIFSLMQSTRAPLGYEKKQRIFSK